MLIGVVGDTAMLSRLLVTLIGLLPTTANDVAEIYWLPLSATYQTNKRILLSCPQTNINKNYLFIYFFDLFLNIFFNDFKMHSCLRVIVLLMPSLSAPQSS